MTDKPDSEDFLGLQEIDRRHLEIAHNTRAERIAKQVSAPAPSGPAPHDPKYDSQTAGDAAAAEQVNQLARQRRLLHVPLRRLCCSSVDSWIELFASRQTLSGTTGAPFDFTKLHVLPEWAAFIDHLTAKNALTDVDPVDCLSDFFAFSFAADPGIRPADETKSKYRHAFLRYCVDMWHELGAGRDASVGEIFASAVLAETMFERYHKFIQFCAQNPEADFNKQLFRLERESPPPDHMPPVPRGPGLEMGRLKTKSVQEVDRVLALARELRGNQQLLRILRLAGRMTQLGIALQQQRTSWRFSEETEIRRGGELQDILPDELNLSAFEPLRLETTAKIVDRDYLANRRIRHQSLVRGPIVIMVDESGSMGYQSGRTKYSRLEEAKALGMALAGLAKQQNRWFAMTSWASEGQVRTWTVPPEQEEATAELISFASHDFGGGTSLPLMEAIRVVDEACLGGYRPDVVIITDGDVGSRSRYGEVAQKFITWRAEREVRVFGLAIACQSSVLSDISTHYFEANDLDLTEAAVRATLGI